MKQFTNYQEIEELDYYYLDLIINKLNLLSCSSSEYVKGKIAKAHCAFLQLVKV